MRGVTVCVEFDDLLAITLPHNRHHFDEFLVITTPQDYKTQEVARRNNAGIYMTEAFYKRNAIFNKWLALELGLDSFGRHGLLVLMDADVLWPRDVDHSVYRKGFLYTPRRRCQLDISAPPASEDRWGSLPLYRDVEWAGYSQIFYADDPHLPEPPWHEINWLHAGGADSFFQDLWPKENKVRPAWECLHLGDPGSNWCGRTGVRTDGRLVEKSSQRSQTLRNMLSLRRVHRNYTHEKLTEL